MSFRLGGVQISLHFGFFLLILLFLLLGHTGLESLCLFSLCIHEMGHLISLRAFGVRLESVRFSPFGIDVRRRGDWQLGYGQELLVTTAGCMANFLAAAFLLWIWRQDGAFHWMAFAAVSTAVGIFNLLPIHGLDGGDIILHGFALLGRREWGERVSLFLSLVVLLLILVGAIWLQNIFLAVAAVYLGGVLFIKK